jgi:RNA recognition motif-containing protein
MEVKLYVGNLSSTTTEDDLRTLFAQAGQVASVDLVKDRETGNFKGFRGAKGYQPAKRL